MSLNEFHQLADVALGAFLKVEVKRRMQGREFLYVAE